MKKLIALFLCAAMVFSLVACTQEPAAPSAAEVYTKAADALKALTDVTLELVIDTMTMVGCDEFTEKSTQTLTYQGIGTEEAMISMDESLEFGLHLPQDDDDEDTDEEPLEYSEIWYKDTVYATESEDYKYSGKVESTAGRYTPAVLLDAALYGTVTSETSETGTKITFADATAAEAWAVPQDATLVKASGNAFIDPEGKLTEMHYEITYNYGSTQVSKTVDSKPQATPAAITAPDADDYIAITYVDALRAMVTTISGLGQMDTVTVSNAEAIISEAAAMIQSQSFQGTLHGRKKDTIAKIDTMISQTNYANNKTETYKLEENYQGGKLTTTVNDGLPSTSSVDWEDVREYMSQLIFAGYLDTDYWQDVTSTDLGSLYYLEFTLNDNFGNTMQNSICSTLWSDPSFLMNFATDYKNTDMNGYLSIDKFTGLPVAAGYYYKGVHTIEKKDYALSMQFDQSIESPDLGAYKAITDKVPTEEEPEDKATPLFYKVTGANGQEMWLLGTIHVGDERTAYLPQEIQDAFKASDALAIECNNEAFEEQVTTDKKMQEKVSKLYFYTDGKEHLKTLLGEEKYENALKLLKSTGSYNTNMPYAKPFLWNTAIEQFFLRQGYQLHQDQGVEARLMTWAKDQKKDIIEIESSLAQLQMLSGFSDELSTWILESSLELGAQEYWESTTELYELWCEGNEETLRAEIADVWGEMTEEEKTEYKSLMEEYNKGMSIDRNEGMLKAAIEYLESGEVIFYAVGLAHLLDSTNGLVDALQQAGYTVELVQYAA